MSNPGRLSHVEERIGDAIRWARDGGWVRAEGSPSVAAAAMCSRRAAAALHEAETDMANLTGEDVDELKRVIGELRGILR